MRYFLLLIIVSTFACKSGDSSDAAFVDEDEIYQQYHVDYDENNKELFASVNFRYGGVNGRTLIVDSTGSISFNGDSMKRSKHMLGGFFYKSTYKTDNPGIRQNFVLKTADGDLIENSVDLFPIGINVPDSVENYKDLVLPINMATLRDTETVIIQIEDTATSITLSFSKKEIVNSRIVLKSALLKAINGQEAVFSIKRTADVPLSKSFKKGGFIRVEYVQLRKTVKMVRNNALT